MKFLLTCGGTAGHINPALGVAERLRELMPDSEFMFVGAEGRMECDLVPREGFPIKTVKITNIRRGLSLEMIKHNIATAKNVLAATKQAKQIIKEFQPDVAVGTGGYVCYPVLKAAAAMGIPTAVHESNAVPGLTTKMLSGVVDSIMVGFEESRSQYRYPERVTVTGTPVREEFRSGSKSAARAELGIPDDVSLVVSVWGSLGSDYMNEIMVSFIERACHKPSMNIIHSAGTRGYKHMLDRLKEEGAEEFSSKGIDVREYIYDMGLVMRAADIVMCRAGASTLSELAAMGKPAILVPSPNVTNNHQEKNARVLENAGAAKVFLEGRFTADSLIGTVSDLLEDKALLDEMSRNMRALSVDDPTERITEIILSLAHK